MTFWSSIKEYFSLQRKLNDLPNSTNSDVTIARPNDPIDPMDSLNPMEEFISNSYSMEPHFFPTEHEIVEVLEERMNRIMKSFNYQRTHINGREYFYQNRDSDTNYFTYYKYQYEPEIYVNGKKIEQDPQSIQELYQRPDKLRDLFIKPEYRHQETRNGNDAEPIVEIDLEDYGTLKVVFFWGQFNVCFCFSKINLIFA